MVAKVVQTVKRTSGRTFVFSGYTEPAVAGIPVAVYRNGANGGSVLVGRTVTDATGGYSVTRTFVGNKAESFLFFTRTGANKYAGAGTSSARQVSIPRR